jgi:catalase
MAKDLSPRQAVSLIESVAKTPKGYRRAHARGLVTRGTFVASPEAKVLTVAEHLRGETIPCLVRFSNASGNPCAPDRMSDKAGRVLGLAIRFDLPSGAKATWGAINIPVFPARTPEEFLAFTEAQRTDRKGKPNMLKVLWHIVRHLHILAGVKAIKAMRPSGSFAMETYRGLHTYWFRSGQGRRQAFRYEWVPQLESRPLGPAEAKAKPKQYLLDDLRAKLASGPLVWDLVSVLAETGDVLDDASVAWPQGRKRVVLGRLTVDRVHEDQKAVEGIVFDPTQVPSGIELSEDPILKFRAAAYGESFERRSREVRAEPAPADMGQ